MGLIKSTDDFEILDGLKQNAGKKKQMGGYAAIANLQVPQRFDHGNMCPVAMVISKVVEKQTMLRVYAGVDPATGKIVEEDFCSIGAQLRGLLNPDGTGGRIINGLHSQNPTMTAGFFFLRTHCVCHLAHLHGRHQGPHS